MDFKIERIDKNNYILFDNMVFWRENGFEREVSPSSLSDQMIKELNRADFYVFAVMVEGRFVGWISLTYIPKIGNRWNGHGHIYVDELWIQPNYRGRGLAKALMKKADDLKSEYQASGIRLYVNINNPTAQKLYESCGYIEDGQALFMEK